MTLIGNKLSPKFLIDIYLHPLVQTVFMTIFAARETSK